MSSEMFFCCAFHITYPCKAALVHDTVVINVIHYSAYLGNIIRLLLT